jgi:hypothetical protein
MGLQVCYFYGNENSMIKRVFPVLLAIGCCLLVTACNMATPENYFDQAVLNANMINGISNDGMMSDLVYPSAKLVPGTKDQTTPMTRMEMLNNKIQFVEEALGKIKGLKETTDTKEMLQTSIALHEYVLGIYKKDYQELAKLYDDGASQDLIAAKAQAIHDQYSTRYEELFNKLISLGKTYASANHIKVNWGK